jgi:hypothetical protein
MSGVSFTVWACALIGLSCDASTPNMTVIQSAYEREASSGSKLHDKGLRVLEAACDEDGAARRFLCQVTFLSKDDPNERLYFDVVAVARTDKGWELRSGLCKR